MTETAHRLRMMAIRSANTMPGQGKPIHYSDEWFTPAHIPASLGEFDLDPCAGPSNHARRNIRLPECGLSIPWEGRVWLNPPYSNVHEWLARLIEHGQGTALVNARPETLWFQKAVSTAKAVFWPRGRINFIRPDGKPTHPPVGSCLIAYGDDAEALAACTLPGRLMWLSPSPSLPLSQSRSPHPPRPRR